MPSGRLDSEGIQAEIAQLVEHDLAKVGVASSSLVFRSFFFAQMAELVDACVSGAHAARCAGSSPVLGTLARTTAQYDSRLRRSYESSPCSRSPIKISLR